MTWSTGGDHHRDQLGKDFCMSCMTHFEVMCSCVMLLSSVCTVSYCIIYVTHYLRVEWVKTHSLHAAKLLGARRYKSSRW